MNWSHVDYLWIVVTLLCTFGLMTPIQAPLVSDLKPFFLQICYDKETTHLHLGWPEGEYIFSKFPF